MLPQDLPSEERPSVPAVPTILHVAQPVDGGVARVVADLVRAQVAAGLRVVVAAPPGGALHRDVATAGAEVALWFAGRSPGRALAGEIRRLSRLIRRTGPDLVHAHSAKAGLAARLAVRGRIPTVHQPHAWSFEAAGGATGRLALAWERCAARWSDRVLCVSEAERLRGAAMGVAARWAVIRNGVDLERFHPGCSPAETDGRDETEGTEGADKRDETGAGVRRRLRAALSGLGLPVADDAPLVVCVGRLCPQKGQLTLLRAWPGVAAAVPDARLVLVGDGPDRRLLESAAPPGVLFAGAVDNVVPWYRAADLVVLPSRWEGMALAPLEAMACARPVVVTDVSGARESLPPGTESGCLVPPDDPDALARALRGLLTAPQLRVTLGRRALEHVRTTYDVRWTTAAVLDLYRELLGLPCPETREQIRR
ncbi:glycosyltransferase family 4 protein [Streptomyces piniterrae]|uniref:Glycosyltransferase family 4 protein n=1 Tax=Streptomyces piniterrae TaxID=2571125 RepID=A0A4U0NNP0_9ACTN|nr:glycosyltransferase family 4 protein [Streptomyces piniterrae]TJZ55943.1 glycosyltransferase family 4 protein [Streptomyces piniterrae]